jgi:beta-carotene 3-hydroxylase
MTIAVVVLASFSAMELVSYSLHRWVMHGFGIAWHRSHHRDRSRGWERNDRFPVVMATIAIVLFAVGGGPSSTVFWAAVGVTAYGVAYLFVHDVYIHERLGFAPPRARYLEWLRVRHRVHHEQGGEPYGMLLPWRRAASLPSTRARRPRL